jgi:hypothetical protein
VKRPREPDVVGAVEWRPRRRIGRDARFPSESATPSLPQPLGLDDCAAIAQLAGERVEVGHRDLARAHLRELPLEARLAFGDGRRDRRLVRRDRRMVALLERG